MYSWYLNITTLQCQHCQFCHNGQGLVHLTKGSLPKEQHENTTLILLPFAVVT